MIEAGAESFSLCSMADVWMKGTPPEAGGQFDQLYQITEACRIVWNEDESYRMKRLGPLAALIG